MEGLGGRSYGKSWWLEGVCGRGHGWYGRLQCCSFPGEISGDCILSGAIRSFSSLIDDLELKDLPLQGGPLTWKGGLNNQRMAKLDRFFILEGWENHFSLIV